MSTFIVAAAPEKTVVVVDGDRPVVLVDDAPDVFVVAFAEQGIPGADGSTRTTYDADAVVSGHRALIVTAGGKVRHADQALAAHFGAVVGVSTNAADADAPVVVQSNGVVDFNGWAWTADSPVFLSNNGLLTQSVPTGGFVQIIGWARSATRLLVNIQPPIFSVG